MAGDRKLIVEVVDAHDLMPKDGHGSSSPFVVVEFSSQQKKTETKVRDLNPVWNETMSFQVPGPIRRNTKLKVKVKHDKNHGPVNRSSSLGWICLNPTRFGEKGNEKLIYYRLKRGMLNNVKGEIGLKVYYVNEELSVPALSQESATAAAPPVEPEIIAEEPPEKEKDEILTASPETQIGQVEPGPKPEPEAPKLAPPPRLSISSSGVNFSKCLSSIIFGKFLRRRKSTI